MDSARHSRIYRSARFSSRRHRAPFERNKTGALPPPGGAPGTFFLAPGGRCLFEVYNKHFARPHGIEGRLAYDERSDRFLAKDPTEGIQSLKLYARAEWDDMLAANGLTIVTTSGWKWKQDPDPPPWRGEYLIAQKGGGLERGVGRAGRER